MTDSSFARVRDPFAPRPTAPSPGVDPSSDAVPSSRVGLSADSASATVRRIAFVCTGNVCRSAYAEALLRHLVPSINVTSAGTHPLTGEPMEALMATELAARGVSATAHRAREVDADVVNADLILVMSLRQRQYLVEEYPARARRIGLLGDIAALRDGALRKNAPGYVAQTRHLLTAQDIARWTRRRPPREAQIADPYRRGPEAAAHAAREIDAAVGVLAQLLTHKPEAPAAMTRGGAL